MKCFNKSSLIASAFISIATLSSVSVNAKSVTLDHIMGSTTLESSPQRVVVIGTGALDAVDALDIKPIAVSKGTALPDYLDQYNAKNIASSGTIFEPDFETIYTQKPDSYYCGPTQL